MYFLSFHLIYYSYISSSYHVENTFMTQSSTSTFTSLNYKGSKTHHTSTVKHAHAVTSIKQPPVLQGHLFLVLS